MTRAFGVGLLAVCFATASWGVQLPLARDAFEVLDPFHITAVRYLVAALCLLPVLVLREGWTALSYAGAEWLASGLGVIGMCGSPMLVFYGMSLSRAEHAVVIVTLQPLIAVLAYWLLRGQRPAPFTLVCIGAAFAGVILVVTRGEMSFVESTRQVIGDCIVLVGAACWVVYTIGLGRLSGWSIWRITVLTMIPGVLATTLLTTLLVTVGYLGVPRADAWLTVGWELAYLTFVGVLMAMLAWNFGARRVGALNATLFINCMPVTTFVYRAAQGQRFTAAELAGATLVVGALIANNLYLRRRALRSSLAAA